MPRKNDAGKRFKGEMQQEVFRHSPLDDYLHHMRSAGEEGAEIVEALEADLIETFSTESGLRCLKLFEKAVLLSSQPNGCSDGALRETNAVRNFVLNIRRIVAHG